MNSQMISAPKDANAAGWKKVYRQLDHIRSLLQKIEADLAMTVPEGLRLKSIEDKKRVAEIIKSVVAAKYEISLPQLCGRCRREDLVWPRHVAIYLCKHVTQLSLTALGTIFERDHGSIHHAIEQITARCSIDPIRRAEVEGLRNTLESKITVE